MLDPRFCGHCLSFPSLPSELSLQRHKPVTAILPDPLLWTPPWPQPTLGLQPVHVKSLSHRTSWLQEFSSSGPEFIGSSPIHPLFHPLEGSKKREGHAAELNKKKARLHWWASDLARVSAGGCSVSPTLDILAAGAMRAQHTTRAQGLEEVSPAPGRRLALPERGRGGAHKGAGELAEEFQGSRCWSLRRGPKALPSSPSFPRTTARNTQGIGFESNSINYWPTSDCGGSEHRCREEGGSHMQVPIFPLVRGSRPREYLTVPDLTDAKQCFSTPRPVGRKPRGAGPWPGLLAPGWPYTQARSTRAGPSPEDVKAFPEVGE
ncbi:unnamed protein product [Nyctereutes procyonoides]|uniref:(raccoon dog) hypothetical protein n=1 Tax=Nyctereutes procyonoides TaxID=34880 RepID=A0A811XUR8_NYCPR|nr:unnamed protein product [Nyctereutes procyonoides]